MNDQARHTRSSRTGWILKRAITGLAVLGAGWAALHVWDHYARAPWTRDGRVRADVVQIAPDVSGLISSIKVVDNQNVQPGTLLFEVDPARFVLVLKDAQAEMRAARIAYEQARREDLRNSGLGELLAAEAREQSRMRREQAESALGRAQVAVEKAELDLQRAQVRAPMNARVTNLDLRKGAYATAGRPAMALIDTDSLYVEGYFEETKLPRVHIGDRVRVLPMWGGEIGGRVESIAGAIADRDRSTSANLLSSVSPTFNWVRLAQRIPVRVKLDALAQQEHLVAGQTVTVEVIETRDERAPVWSSAGGRH